MPLTTYVVVVYMLNNTGIEEFHTSIEIAQDEDELHNKVCEILNDIIDEDTFEDCCYTYMEINPIHARYVAAIVAWESYEDRSNPEIHIEVLHGRNIRQISGEIERLMTRINTRYNYCDSMFQVIPLHMDPQEFTEQARRKIEVNYADSKDLMLDMLVQGLVCFGKN